MKKIVVITPIKNIEQVRYKCQAMINIPEIDLEFQGLKSQGIEGVATYFDRTVIAPQILSLAYQAEKSGADAVIINCLSEPALQAAKELLSIPTVGIFEATLQSITTAGKNFSILVPKFHPNYLQMLNETIKIFGLQDSLKSFSEINIEEEEANQQATIIAAIKDAILSHHSQAIILSSTYLAQLGDFCCQTLKTLDYHVPVIIPIIEGINYIAQIFSGQLTYNKANFLPPRFEKVKQWREYDTL